MDLDPIGDGVAEDGMRCVTGALKGLLKSFFALAVGVGVVDLVEPSGGSMLDMLLEVSRVGNGFEEDKRGSFEISEVDFGGVAVSLTAFRGRLLRCGDGEGGEGGLPLITAGSRDDILNTGLNRAPPGNAGRLIVSFSRYISSIDFATFKFPSSPSLAMCVGVLGFSDVCDTVPFARFIAQSRSTMGIFHSFAFAHLIPSPEGHRRWVQWDEKLSEVLMPRKRN
jgi:hypothetical protein